METLTLEQYPELFELFKPNIKIKDIKKKLKEIRGIDEKDLRFQIVFPNSLNEFNDDNNFMNNIKFQIYDITKYKKNENIIKEDINILKDIKLDIDEKAIKEIKIGSKTTYKNFLS